METAERLETERDREIVTRRVIEAPRHLVFRAWTEASHLAHWFGPRGFTTTTPIQSAVVPIIMEGDDLIGCADTGTGKTAAFLLPILNRLLKTRAAAPEERGYTRVLILAPTRELAVQIEDDVQGFSYHTDLTSIAVYGGVPMELKFTVVVPSVSPSTSRSPKGLVSSERSTSMLRVEVVPPVRSPS